MAVVAEIQREQRWRYEIEDALVIFNGALHDAGEDRKTAPFRIAEILRGDAVAVANSGPGCHAAEVQRLCRVVSCEIVFKTSVAMKEERRRREDGAINLRQERWLQRILCAVGGLARPEDVVARRKAIELVDDAVLEAAKLETLKSSFLIWDRLKGMYATSLRYLRDEQLATLSRIDEDESELLEWLTHISSEQNLRLCMRTYNIPAIPEEHDHPSGVLEVDTGIGRGAAAAALLEAVPRPGTTDANAHTVPTANQLVGAAIARAARTCGSMMKYHNGPRELRDRVQASLNAAAMTTMKLLQEALQYRLGIRLGGDVEERDYLLRALMVVNVSLSERSRRMDVD